MSNVATNQTDALKAFEGWLEWLDSDDGMVYRKSRWGDGRDYDLACTVPTPPGMTIVTVGDIRNLVELARKGLSSEQG